MLSKCFVYKADMFQLMLYIVLAPCSIVLYVNRPMQGSVKPKPYASNLLFRFYAVCSWLVSLACRESMKDLIRCHTAFTDAMNCF